VGVKNRHFSSLLSEKTTRNNVSGQERPGGNREGEKRE
jgi:hypothetical protein